MATTRAFSFEPMFCQGAEWPPEGPEWRCELKLDGFRAIGRKSGRAAQLWSRNQKDFVRRFPGVVKTIRELPDDTVIDGEIVALDERGNPSFNLLQGVGEPAATVMYAFRPAHAARQRCAALAARRAPSATLRSRGACQMIPSDSRKRLPCPFRSWSRR